MPRYTLFYRDNKTETQREFNMLEVRKNENTQSNYSITLFPPQKMSYWFKRYNSPALRRLTQEDPVSVRQAEATKWAQRLPELHRETISERQTNQKVCKISRREKTGRKSGLEAVNHNELEVPEEKTEISLFKSVLSEPWGLHYGSFVINLTRYSQHLLFLYEFVLSSQ